MNRYEKAAQNRSKAYLLNRDWHVGAAQARYRETGNWYHRVNRFPAALFDARGYILFPTEKTFRACQGLQIGKQIGVPGGISSLPGYVPVVDSGSPPAVYAHQVPPGLLGIEWTDYSKGYIDLLRTELFANVGTAPEITHAVSGPHGGLYQARCRLTVRETTADLDYEAFPEFNTRWGMLLGLLRLHFPDANRNRLVRVEWRYKGRKRFSPTATAVIITNPLPPLAPYKLEKGTGKRVMREVRERPGQIPFRRKLMIAYGGQCCISACSVSEALDGAHIDPFCGASSDHPQNGLLLRQDLHSLFDADLLAVDPDTRIIHFAARTLDWPEYAALNGTAQLAEPKAGGDSYRPSHAALRRRWRRFNADA